MHEVYKFLGIGPSFSKLLNFCEQIALLKIELDPRISSVYNHMLVPRPVPHLIPQEDVAMQPDPAALLRRVPVPVPAPALDPELAGEGINVLRHENNNPFHLESNRETDKVDSFADDKTATFRATREGLAAICEILGNFAGFSGLKCNMDKSAIMFVGSEDPPPTLPKRI